MKISIYSKDTGSILRSVTATEDVIAIQCGDGEEFYLNCPPEATHIINGEPITIAPPPPTTDELFANIRGKRMTLLAACDWTQITDSPLSHEQRAAWATYRQALRDLPATCDLSDPVWPDAPEVLNV